MDVHREATRHGVAALLHPWGPAMTTTPETKYAKSGDVYIAYQVVGDGPRDLVLVPPFVSHVELYWE